jgi:LPS-assembly lipoprotein
MKKATIIASVMLILSACGFQPLYGEIGGSSAVEDLSMVEITPLPDRLGQLVHNRLLDGMQPQGPAAEVRYQLTLNLSEETVRFGFRQDESVTRERYTLTAHYQLTSLTDGSVLSEGDTSTGSSYDVVRSDFATLSARENAQRRASLMVSDAIILRLGLYFRQLRQETH